MPGFRCPRPSDRRPFHALRPRPAFMLAAFAVAIAASWAVRFDVAFAQHSPTLQTGGSAYPAGDEVSISGQGFAPHESVTLAVTHEDGTAEPGMRHEPTVVTADNSGLLSATWAISAGDIVSRQFVVSAIGAVSGVVRSNVFLRRPAVATDSNWYAAGSTATIAGRDFTAGEMVTVRVVHADGAAEPGMGHEPSMAMAGPGGTFQLAWSPRAADLAGPRFIVTAAGSNSGEVAPATFWRIAAMSTDKADYQPGETVVITGRGFAPHELVTVRVTHADGRTDGNGHEPFYATADRAGSVTATW